MQIKHYLAALETELANTQYGQTPTELYQPIEYLMSLGGKRIRPLLTVMATALFTDSWQHSLRPALAVEVFHNFTLMHDDIMDKAPLRRGKPTVHARWNENVAILSGDVMLVAAYQMLLDIEPQLLKRVLERFSRTAAEVCEGQQYDMSFEQRDRVSVEEYLEMIRLKTSVLLGFAMELGGILGATTKENITKLYDIGLNVGMGFQVKDDILDVYGQAAQFGKQVGGDIMANKKTLLLIEALRQAEGSAAEELNAWLLATDFDPIQKVAGVTNIYNALNIRQQAETKMNQYFATAFSSLEALEVTSERKQALKTFFEALITRES